MYRLNIVNACLNIVYNTDHVMADLLKIAQNKPLKCEHIFEQIRSLNDRPVVFLERVPICAAHQVLRLGPGERRLRTVFVELHFDGRDFVYML